LVARGIPERGTKGFLGGIAVLVASLSILALGYTVVPALLGRLGASPTAFYLLLVGVEAVLAGISYAAYRVLLPHRGLEGSRHAASGASLGSRAARSLAVAAALAGGYAVVAGVLGWRPSGISGVVGSLLVSAVYAALMVPAALAVRASRGLRGYAVAGAVTAGILALNPEQLVVAYTQASPQAALGALVAIILGAVLGAVALSADEALGLYAAYTVMLASAVLWGGIPFRPSSGALGLLLAGLAGLYAAYTTASLLAGLDPLARLRGTQESPKPRATVSPGVKVASDDSGHGREAPLYRRPLFWAALGLAVAASALALAGVMFWHPLVVVTGSMKPHINPGDVVILRKTTHIGVGDVIAFKVKGIVVTHRVVDVRPDGSYLTKGDANNAVDPWSVSPRDVIGKMWLRIPAVGWLVILAGWNSVTRLLVAGVASAILAYVIIRW